MHRMTHWAIIVAAVTLIGGGRTLWAVEVLGTGTGALLGDDLTDIGNDGIETFYAPPGDYGGFDATFFSSDEPGFEGGEFAFNVFDNVVDAGNAKWCCGTVFPQIVGADFTEPLETAYRLTHFTVASANDVPERDPVVWRIEGSNDGECWIPIFSEEDLANAVDALGGIPGTSIWTERLQVIRFDEGEDYPEQDTAYSMFRMVTLQTALTTGAFFQVGEIEFFGEEGEPPADPGECPTCSDRVINVQCTASDEGLDVSWEIPEKCNCPDPTGIFLNGVEYDTVDADATSISIPRAAFPGSVFSVEVRNCSGLGSTCSPFLTTLDGSLIANAFLALGPFSTPVACDNSAALLLANPIGPEESLACQYPADGDPVEGYVPGDPLFPDPNTASTMGYHAAAPTDNDGNPIWRPFSDASPTDGDLDFDQDVVGGLDEHVMFIATWIENTSDQDIEVQVCFGSDDDGQVWLDNEVVLNDVACRGRAPCQSSFLMTIPSGVHVVKVGVWEQGGGWGAILSFVDPVTGEPIVDLAGLLDIDQLVGVSVLSEDIVFHGRERPANFDIPDCDETPVCLPVTNVFCIKNPDGTIDIEWENSEACTGDISIYAGNELVATLEPGTTDYTIEDEEFRFASSVSVDNGSFTRANCLLVEVIPTLIGGDLTDLDDDGLEDFYLPPDDLGGFDAIFFSSDEPGFNGLEFAFNVFDNVVGGGNDKWCCGTVFPQIVGADFSETQETAYRLTEFTVASANDTPERDPRVWSIEGSNDGIEWTPIFTQDNPNASLWTERLQILRFEEGRDYPEQTQAYSMFRMVTEATGLVGGAFFQVAEIEFFGEEGSGVVEICDNGTDDDGDGDIDCADSQCAGDPACAGARFIRGNADGVGAINITDGVFVLNYLFTGGGDPPCKDAADADDTGVINITDGVYILNFLFTGGAEPKSPFPGCGVDPTPDSLDCLTPHAACQ